MIVDAYLLLDALGPQELPGTRRFLEYMSKTQSCSGLHVDYREIIEARVEGDDFKLVLARNDQSQLVIDAYEHLLEALEVFHPDEGFPHGSLRDVKPLTRDQLRGLVESRTVRPFTASQYEEDWGTQTLEIYRPGTNILETGVYIGRSLQAHLQVRADSKAGRGRFKPRRFVPDLRISPLGPLEQQLAQRGRVLASLRREEK